MGFLSKWSWLLFPRSAGCAHAGQPWVRGRAGTDTTDEPEAEEKESKETPDKTEYDYLLNMPLDQHLIHPLHTSDVGAHVHSHVSTSRSFHPQPRLCDNHWC